MARSDENCETFLKAALNFEFPENGSTIEFVSLKAGTLDCFQIIDVEKV